MKGTGWKYSEIDGRFLLSRGVGGSYADLSTGGDIGRGSGQQEYAFQTESERSMFVYIEDLREAVACLQAEIARLKTVRGANQNLRAVRAARRAAKA